MIHFLITYMMARLNQLIIYDDDRNRHGMSTIYEKSKDKCPLIGNVHGNWWFPEKSHIPESYKKAFGNVFVFGQKEKGAHTPNDFITIRNSKKI